MLEFKPIEADSVAKGAPSVIVDLLRKWSELEPEICRKTFLENVFELSVGGAKIVNLGREATFERVYLINAAIEERIIARGWLCKCQTLLLGKWHCSVHAPFSGSQPRDPYAVADGGTRAIALLKAYLKALGGEI